MQSPKLASILATLTALVAMGTSGCYLQIGENSPERTPDPTGAPSSTSTPTEPPPAAIAAKVSIDPGATVSASPGHSVGVYVEVTSAGHWSVLTTCDTSVSGHECAFDLNVSPEDGSKFSGVTPQGLAYGDAMTVLDDGTVQIVSQTGTLANGLSFDTEPGALVEINVLLEGVPKPGIFRYIGGGVTQEGVPSNPVEFVPAATPG